MAHYADLQPGTVPHEYESIATEMDDRYEQPIPASPPPSVTVVEESNDGLNSNAGAVNYRECYQAFEPSCNYSATKAVETLMEIPRYSIHFRFVTFISQYTSIFNL